MFISEGVLATQFETNYASTVFPCFDEPCIRSTFEISIYSSLSDQVLSNMPLASSQVLFHKRISTFQTTPLMPVYLVGFSIGCFDSYHGHSKSGVPIDIYGPLDRCQLILPFAIDAIDFMEDFTQIKYPLPRLQLVFIPNFIFGGMENNGIITLNQNEGGASYYASLVYHEVSHHWAGNLATIKWWDSLWIPEGLASFFPYLISEKLENIPCHMEIIKHYSQRMLIKDSKPNIRPLQSCTGPETIFDSIAYTKGLLMMNSLRQWCGYDVFQKSLQQLFHQFSFSTFDSNDFIKCFPENVKLIFESFLPQPSYPIAFLEENGSAYLKPFVKNDENINPKKKEILMKRVYHLPIKILIGKDNSLIEKDIILGPNPIVIEEAKDADFIKLNYKNFTYCRTYHDGKWLDALVKAGQDKKIHQIEVDFAKVDFTFINDYMILKE